MADLPSLDGSGAEGVGLFRTELQFLIRNQMPKRSEIRAMYKRVMDAAGGKTHTLQGRTLCGNQPMNRVHPTILHQVISRR